MKRASGRIVGEGHVPIATRGRSLGGTSCGSRAIHIDDLVAGHSDNGCGTPDTHHGAGRLACDGAAGPPYVPVLDAEASAAPGKGDHPLSPLRADTGSGGQWLCGDCCHIPADGDTATHGGAIVVYQAEGSGKQPAATPDDWEHDLLLRDDDDEIYLSRQFTLDEPAHQKIVSLPIVDDQEREGDETLVVSIARPARGNPTKDSDLQIVLEPSSVTVTILDNDPPAQPTGLTPIPDHQAVTLRWDDPKDGTIINNQYLRDERTSWTNIPGRAPGERNATSYTLRSLTNNIEYSFRIRAVNSIGDHGYSIPTDAATVRVVSPVGDPSPSPEDAGPSVRGSSADPTIAIAPAPTIQPADTSTHTSTQTPTAETTTLRSNAESWNLGLPLWLAIAVVAGVVILVGGILLAKPRTKKAAARRRRR